MQARLPFLWSPWQGSSGGGQFPVPPHPGLSPFATSYRKKIWLSRSPANFLAGTGGEKRNQIRSWPVAGPGFRGGDAATRAPEPFTFSNQNFPAGWWSNCKSAGYTVNPMEEPQPRKDGSPEALERQRRGPRPETGHPRPMHVANTRKDPLATSVGEKGTGPIAPPTGFACVPWERSDLAEERTGEQLCRAINRGPSGPPPASDGDASSGVFPSLQLSPPPRLWPRAGAPCKQNLGLPFQGRVTLAFGGLGQKVGVTLSPLTFCWRKWEGAGAGGNFSPAVKNLDHLPFSALWLRYGQPEQPRLHTHTL